MTTALSTSAVYTIPGLEGTWRISGLETTELGANGQAILHMRRDISATESEWQCKLCGSLRRVRVSLNGGYSYRSQCVPCGTVDLRTDAR